MVNKQHFSGLGDEIHMSQLWYLTYLVDLVSLPLAEVRIAENVIIQTRNTREICALRTYIMLQKNYTFDLSQKI